jgi:hypothetical protein
MLFSDAFAGSIPNTFECFRNTNVLCPCQKKSAMLLMMKVLFVSLVYCD